MILVCVNVHPVSCLCESSRLTSLHVWQGGTIAKYKTVFVLTWNLQVKYFWVFGSFRSITDNHWLSGHPAGRNQIQLDKSRVFPRTWIHQMLLNPVSLTSIEPLHEHIWSHYRDNLWVCSVILVSPPYFIFSGYAPNLTLTQCVDQFLL